MAKNVSLKATTAIDLGLSAIEREVVNSARDALASEKEKMAREIAAMVSASKDGKASKTFSDLYRAAVVAEILGFAAGDAGLAKARELMAEGVKRDEKQQLAILAAGNRLSRRLIAAGLATANPRKPRNKNEKPKNGPVIETPTLATPAAWMNFFGDVQRMLENVQRKNDKSLDAKAKACLEDLAKTIAYHAMKSAK